MKKLEGPWGDGRTKLTPGRDFSVHTVHRLHRSYTEISCVELPVSKKECMDLLWRYKSSYLQTLIMTVLLYEVPHRIYRMCARLDRFFRKKTVRCHITPSPFVEQNWHFGKHLRWQGVRKVALTQKDGTFWCLTVSARSWEWFGYEIDAVIEELGFQSSRESVEIIFSLKPILAFRCHKWNALSSNYTVLESIQKARTLPSKTKDLSSHLQGLTYDAGTSYWAMEWILVKIDFSTGNLVPLELTNQSFNCGIRKKFGPVQFYSFAIIYRIKASSLEIWWSFCLSSLLAEG